METFRVDDATLRCHECDHCGGRATEADAQAAVARYRKEMGVSPCAVCGEEIRHRIWDVRHAAEDGTPTWFATPTDFELPVVLKSALRRVSVAGVLHDACARRALPHLPVEFWQGPEGGAVRETVRYRFGWRPAPPV